MTGRPSDNDNVVRGFVTDSDSYEGSVTVQIVRDSE